MQVRQEYVKERLGTGELDQILQDKKYVFSYLPYLNNMGAKKNMTKELSEVIKTLSCLNYCSEKMTSTRLTQSRCCNQNKRRTGRRQRKCV
jgi:hypothetical protein